MKKLGTVLALVLLGFVAQAQMNFETTSLRVYNWSETNSKFELEKQIAYTSLFTTDDSVKILTHYNDNETLKYYLTFVNSDSDSDSGQLQYEGVTGHGDKVTVYFLLSSKLIKVHYYHDNQLFMYFLK